MFLPLGTEHMSIVSTRRTCDSFFYICIPLLADHTPVKDHTSKIIMVAQLILRGFWFWCLFGWLVGCLIGWLVSGLVGWLVGWSVGWLVVWLVFF